VVKLVYEDNGVGILEGNKQKLFHEGFTTGKSSGRGVSDKENGWCLRLDYN
jgi:sensor histidine kinase regulating citrate/malate metabolism